MTLRGIVVVALLLPRPLAAQDSASRWSEILSRLVAPTPYELLGVRPGLTFDSIYVALTEPGTQYACFFTAAESTADCFVTLDARLAPIQSRKMELVTTVDRRTEVVTRLEFRGTVAVGEALEASAAALAGRMEREWGLPSAQPGSKCSAEWGPPENYALVCLDEESQRWRLVVADNRLLEQVARIFPSQLPKTADGMTDLHEWYPIWRPKKLGPLEATAPLSTIIRELGVSHSPDQCRSTRSSSSEKARVECQFTQSSFEIAGHWPQRIRLIADSATTAVTSMAFKWRAMTDMESRELYAVLARALQAEWGAADGQEPDWRHEWKDFPFESFVRRLWEMGNDGSPVPNGYEVDVVLRSFVPARELVDDRPAR